MYRAAKSGQIRQIDTKRLALLAKLVGAPQAKAAGIDLHVRLHQIVERDQPLFTLHSQSTGEMDYALSYLREANTIMAIEEME